MPSSKRKALHLGTQMLMRASDATGGRKAPSLPWKSQPSRSEPRAHTELNWADSGRLSGEGFTQGVRQVHRGQSHCRHRFVHVQGLWIVILCFYNVEEKILFYVKERNMQRRRDPR